MKHRKLRIAWSVGWGIVAVFIFALWVRSNSVCDQLWVRYRQSPDSVLHIVSERGRFAFEPRYRTGIVSLYYEHHPVSDQSLGDPDDSGRRPSGLGFQVLRWGKQTDVLIPDWFSILNLAAIAATSWVRWSKRFTLRTLLIATTLVAILLGLTV
jgi:hypothetical protein